MRGSARARLLRCFQAGQASGAAKRQRHQSFGQHGHAEQRPRRGQTAGFAARDPGQRQQQGCGEGGGHRQVGCAHLAEADPFRAGRQNQRGQPGHRAAELAAQQPPEEDQERDGAQGHRQARGEVGSEAEAERGAGHPIQQGRFFEPRLAPEAGRDPIAGARHFAPDGSVARLIGAEHAGRIQAIEVDQADEGQRDPREERDLRVAPAGFPGGGHVQPCDRAGARLRRLTIGAQVINLRHTKNVIPSARFRTRSGGRRFPRRRGCCRAGGFRDRFRRSSR